MTLKFSSRKCRLSLALAGATAWVALCSHGLADTSPTTMTAKTDQSGVPGKLDATPDEIHALRGFRRPWTFFSPAVASGSLKTSADGHWTLYPGSKGEVLVDWSTSKQEDVVDGWTTTGAVWSPTDGSTMVSWIWEENRNILYVGKPGGPKNKLLPLARRLYTTPPAWAPDGKTVYVCVTLDLPWGKSDPRDDHPPTSNLNVSIAATAAPYAYVAFERRILDKEYPEARGSSNRTVLLAIDVATAQVRLLARGNDASTPFVSPDGKWIAMSQSRPEPKTGHRVSDVYMVPVLPFADLAPIDLEKYEERKLGWFDGAGQRLKPVVDGLGTRLSSIQWSPDSTGFVYATVGRTSTGDVFVFNATTKQTVNLTAGVTSLPPWSKDFGYGRNRTGATWSPKFGSSVVPLWMPDGKAVIALARGDAWLIPVDPALAVRNLTQAVPRQTVRVLSAFEDNQVGLDAKGRMIVVAKDKATRLDSVYRIDVATGESTRLSDTGMWLDLDTMFVDRRAGPLALTGHTAHLDTNLFRLSLSEPSAIEQVSRYKMKLAERNFPETRILSWTTASGEIAGGVLYLPEGAAADHKVPLVTTISAPGSLSSQVDFWMQQGPYALNAEILTSMKDGIAVLEPDIPLSDSGVYEHPMRQMAEGVQAAVDAALATGVIDAGRLGIVGRSSPGRNDQGVYTVESVLTQTDRFKVAACIGTGPNWFGQYAPTAPGYYELGDVRMAVPIWDDPARYTENSPISHWNHVTTPILYINDTNSQNYAGLARIGGVGVAAESRESSQEHSKRIRAWMREHFFGDQPTVQIANIPSFFFGSTVLGDEPESKPAAARMFSFPVPKK